MMNFLIGKTSDRQKNNMFFIKLKKTYFFSEKKTSR